MLNLCYVAFVYVRPWSQHQTWLYSVTECVECCGHSAGQ